MKARWQECKFIPRTDIPWVGLYVTLTRHGEIRLGKRTFEKLGEPTAVTVYFDPPNNRFGLKATHPDMRNAFPVRPKGYAGGKRISIRGVLIENGIDIPETIQFHDANFDDEGILILDLRTARVPKRVMGHPKNIQRSKESGSLVSGQNRER